MGAGGLLGFLYSSLSRTFAQPGGEAQREQKSGHSQMKENREKRDEFSPVGEYDRTVDWNKLCSQFSNLSWRSRRKINIHALL